MIRERIGTLMLVAMSLVTTRAAAQGTIGGQGFGYPVGQLTTRATSTGGALGEFDQAGPHNPAALLNWGVAGAYLQYSPERRSTTLNGVTTRSGVARFPVIAVGLPTGSRIAFGLSSSPLLERNFTTVTTARQLVRTDSVTTTTTESASGGINDLQLGAALQVKPWLRLGTALHVMTGENRSQTVRSIVADTGVRVDTVSYAPISESGTSTFSGTALSFGVEIAPNPKFSVAGSARVGFGLRADLNETSRRTADVPNRAGGAIRWEVGGANIAARYNWEGWSAMRGLGAETSGIFDTQEYGIGAEMLGPRIRGGQTLVRFGARNRDLPFGVSGRQATENLFGGGVGFPLAFGRAQVDLGVERASRTVPGIADLRERAFIMSFGFRIRT